MHVTLPNLSFHGRQPLEFRNLSRALRDPAEHWPPEILERPFVEAHAGPTRLTLIATPEAVTEILLNRGGVFPRARLHDRILGAAYGENLIRGDQADWRQQRREIAQPLSSERAMTLVPRISLACERIIAEWVQGVENPVDILRDARRFALDALWRCFFCDDADAAQVDPLVEQSAAMMDRRNDASLVDHLRDLRPLAERAMERGGPGGELAPLDEFDTARDLNTTLLFLHAGHDNVTATLCWALWLMAHHPDIQYGIRNEWRAATPRPDRPGIDLAAFPLTGAAVRETLRLYPPIMHLIRDVTVDVDVAGEMLPGGFTAVLSLYAMHRNRLWWTNPDSFEPQRFLKRGDDALRRTLWLPFGAGPRGCIGASFAQVELVVALGMIADRFELLPNPGHGLDCRVDWVLRPTGRQPFFARAIA